MENSRAEKLKDSIDETQDEINNIQIVVQGLVNLKNSSNDYEIKSDLQQLINSFDNKIKFLEDLRQDDENVLNQFL